MAQETEEQPKAAAPAKAKAQKAGKGKKRGKRYRGLATKIDRTKTYSPAEAVKLVKETSQAKFDTSVDLHLRMGVDPRHAEQMVRGSAVLPNGTGKTVRVVVFAQGDKAREAQAAGADVVGADDLAKRIEGGWLDFDVAVATPDMMGTVGKLGKVLGPRGLMPNPKSGTVTDDIPAGIKAVKAGRVEFKVDKTANIGVGVGKRSFTPAQITENVAAVLEAVGKAKPAAFKGHYIKSVTLSSSMSPGVKLATAEFNKF
jgi:large subunit ribosomal protein L1